MTTINVDCAHYSGRYDNTAAQWLSQVQRMFAKDYRFVGGTEAGENPGKATLIGQAAKFGYTFFVYKGNWASVKKSVIKSGYEAEGYTIIKNDLVVGPGHDSNIVRVTWFDHQIGWVTYLVTHYPVWGRQHGKPDAQVNLKHTKRMAKALADLAERFSAKGHTVFISADVNMNDKTDDPFFGEDIVSASDELKVYPKTHWSTIDVFARVRSAKNVKARYFRALGDKAFPSASDHNPVEVGYAVTVTPPKEKPMSLKYDSRSGAPSSTRLKYGHVGKPTGITVHHWGSYGQTHDGVAAYLTRKGANTSAHDVLSAGRCTRLVPYSRAAWHSGSNRGNGSTIGVECRPEMSEGDWQALVVWCADREEEFGHLNLFKHSDWKATACPGKYADRLATLRKAINVEHARRGDTAAPTPAPVKKPVLTRSKAILRQGSKGSAVAAMQRGLNRVFPSYSSLAVDGDFGPATYRVVREFQRRAGLVDDGVVGKKTRAALKSYGVKF